MTANMAAVYGIETGFRYITKSIWGREKYNTRFTLELEIAKELIYDLYIGLLMK